MKAFGWWLVMLVAEIGLCFVLAVAAHEWGYADASRAFGRGGIVIAGIGVASSVALAVVMLWVRARAGAGTGAPAPERVSRAASPHGPK